MTAHRDTPIDLDVSGEVDVPVTEARTRLAELLDLVDREDAFVYLTRHGRRIAVIMPADIGENYQRMEDEYFAARTRDRAQGLEEAIPFEEALAKIEAGQL